MNKKYRWKVSSLLSGALALLGFAGCSGDGDDFPEQPSLYGAPVNTMDYRVLGMVTDEDGKPLKDIQVIIDNPRAYVYLDENEKPYGRDSITNKLIPDTTYTDKDGFKFSKKVSYFLVSNFLCLLAILTKSVITIYKKKPSHTLVPLPPIPT